VNSLGGIHGRRLVVDSYDDGFTGALNKQYTEEAIERDFALVGGFSLEDSFGGTLLAADPGVPDVTNPLSHATALLPNTVGPQVSSGGWGTGGFEFIRQRYPADVDAVGDLIADQPSAIASWQVERAAMEHVGYHVVYAQQYAITQSDFTSNVIAMRNAGVKVLFIDQMPENYAASLLRDLVQQNFHPVVVLGPSAYNEALAADSGGAAAVDGAYLTLSSSLFLGEDAPTVPAVSTFLTWVGRVDPGFRPDLFTLNGWTSAELYSRALASAGPRPTRGSVLEALRAVTSFDADGLIVTTDPSARSSGNCYLMARVENGKFQRFDDPPVSGGTDGYICNGSVYFSPA
jgi:branched-chain amino acid transport system substrate-binding protein